MAFKTIKFQFDGFAPLLMHNGRLSDPTGEHSRAIKVVSSKKKKTEDDYRRMSELEWEGGLYVNDDEQLVIAEENTNRMFIQAGRQHKLGKDVEKGLFCTSDSLLLGKNGKPISAKSIAGKPEFRLIKMKKQGMVRVRRTRPIIREWSVVVEIEYHVEVFDHDTVVMLAHTGGEFVGYCDERPRYGRFIATVV